MASYSVLVPLAVIYASLMLGEIAGAIVYYLGLILPANSVTGICLVFVIQPLYALYVKLVEKNELELRFGKEYVKYERITLF